MKLEKFYHLFRLKCFHLSSHPPPSSSHELISINEILSQLVQNVVAGVVLAAVVFVLYYAAVVIVLPYAAVDELMPVVILTAAVVGVVPAVVVEVLI